jgi:flagellar motor switch protein FliM
MSSTESTSAPAESAELPEAEAAVARPFATVPVEPTGPSVERATVYSSAGSRVGVVVSAHDFRRPGRLTESDLRRLRERHDEFARHLAARISLFLRMEFSLKVTSVGTPSYRGLIDSFSEPTHVCLFRVEPLAGVGLLEIPPRLALTLIDRLLGGPGRPVTTLRALTEIEIALLEDVARLVTDEWCGHWTLPAPLKSVIFGNERSGRFLRTAPGDTMMLALTLETALGEGVETLRLAVPYPMIEPAVKAVLPARSRESARESRPAPAASSWRPVYEQVSVPLQAEWDAFTLSLRDLSALQVGDVLELPAGIVDRTRVALNAQTKFIATARLEGTRVVVKLTQRLDSGDPSHAHP